MKHHTKDKGDLATAKTILVLTKRGYAIFFPAFSEHLPFDIIAYKNQKSYRIQVKHRTDGMLPTKCTRKYEDGDFDFYAVYLPTIDRVVFPSIKYKGCSIRCELPNSATPFYWWKDFIGFTSKAKRRRLSDFGKTVVCTVSKSDRRKAGLKRRKTERPSKSELRQLLKTYSKEKIGRMYSVTGSAISKWVKNYGL